MGNETSVQGKQQTTLQKHVKSHESNSELNRNAKDDPRSKTKENIGIHSNSLIKDQNSKLNLDPQNDSNQLNESNQNHQEYHGEISSGAPLNAQDKSSKYDLKELYTTFSISKQKSTLSANQSLQNAKQKIITTFGNLRAVQGKNDSVSDIYYVNSESELQKYKEQTMASELEELRKEIQRSPDIPLLLEDSRVSDSKLSSIRKKIQNVFSGSDSSTPYEELNPRVFCEIIAEFETKILLSYRHLLYHQQMIASQCQKENLHIETLTNQKFKQQLITIKETSKLKSGLQKANREIQQIMNLMIRLESCLPDEIKSKIDTIPFEVIHEITSNDTETK